MTRDAGWFKHDADAALDPKVMRLTRRGGLHAYGAFWIVVEALRRADAYELPDDDAADLAEAFDFIDGTLDLLVECRLLGHENGHYYSESFTRRMGRLDESRAKRQEAGRLGGLAKASNAKAKPKQSQSNALANPSRGEEKREEEKREDKTPEARAPARPRDLYTKEFKAFWSVYPRKKAKGAAGKAWDKAKRTPDWPGLDAIIEAVERQRQSPDWEKDAGQYIPHPSTWLNGRCWEDEVSTQSALAPAGGERLTAMEQQRMRTKQALKDALEEMHNESE